MAVAALSKTTGAVLSGAAARKKAEAEAAAAGRGEAGAAAGGWARKAACGGTVRSKASKIAARGKSERGAAREGRGERGAGAMLFLDEDIHDAHSQWALAALGHSEPRGAEREAGAWGKALMPALPDMDSDGEEAEQARLPAHRAGDGTRARR